MFIYLRYLEYVFVLLIYTYVQAYQSILCIFIIYYLGICTYTSDQKLALLAFDWLYESIQYVPNPAS